MNRIAILTTLFLLVLYATPSVANDPLTFLVAFTPDGSRLVVASHRGGVKVLSVPDLKEVRSFSLEGDRRLRSAAVSPNARWLAMDDVAGALRIWDLESGESHPAVPIKPGSDFPVFVFGPDDDTLFVYQERLSVWDVKQGREVGVMNGVRFVQMMSVSPDGRSLAVYGRCISGRLSGNVCVCAIDEKKIVVATDFEEKSDSYPADLVYTKDDRILVTQSGPSAESDAGVHTHPLKLTYQSRFLKPDDLTVLETTVVEPERGWHYPGLRSAPIPQYEVVSADGKWKATAYQKRLYLYRIAAADSRPTLEKFIPVP
jgi:WD40 repeat protein